MNIHDYPHLCESLGPAGVDRIAAHLKDEQYTPSSKRVRFIQNPHRDMLMWQNFGENPAVDDILTGICRLDDGTEKGLNPARLLVLLQTADRISSEMIAAVMRVQDRQARRYMAASKLAIKYLSHLVSPRELVRSSPTLAELRARRCTYEEANDRFHQRNEIPQVLETLA